MFTSIQPGASGRVSVPVSRAATDNRPAENAVTALPIESAYHLQHFWLDGPAVLIDGLHIEARQVHPSQHGKRSIRVIERAPHEGAIELHRKRRGIANGIERHARPRPGVPGQPDIAPHEVRSRDRQTIRLATGPVDEDSEKDPSPAVVTAARSQVGSIRASATGCRDAVSTSMPDTDHVVAGGAGGFGVGVGETGGEEDPPPHAAGPSTAIVAATIHR